MPTDEQALRRDDPCLVSATIEKVPGAAGPKNAPQRLDWLFRESIRRQTIHPLRALVGSYRTGDDA